MQLVKNKCSKDFYYTILMPITLVLNILVLCFQIYH